MGWEERGGRSYYYRKERDGERVVSRYVGTGYGARLIAESERALRREAKERRRAWERQRRSLERPLEAVRRAEEAVRLLRDAALIAAGYHTHKGQWRRTRTEAHMASITTKADGQTRTIDGFPDDMDLNAISDLFDRANKEKPKPADVQAFREALSKYPQLWRVAGDMVETAKDALLKATAATPAMQESVRQGMTELARSLGYDEAPVLERLLIDQVVMTWLHVYKVQYSYHRITSGSHNMDQGRYWEARLSAAQRRHVRAVEALARVRKLGSSRPLQINIAQQQVNVAG